MKTVTRRRVLQGVAGALLSGLAGCDTSIETTVTAGEGEHEGVERDPENYALRNPADEPPAWIVPEGEERESDTDERERRPFPNMGLIASQSAADRIRYADVDGIAEAKSFVAGTDFERETLLLEPYSVGACFERKLCAIGWSSTEYHTYYARLYRPADYRCEVGDEDVVVRFVRIPDTLDPDAVNGSGSAYSTQSCPRPGRHGVSVGPRPDAPENGTDRNRTANGVRDETGVGKR